MREQPIYDQLAREMGFQPLEIRDAFREAWIHSVWLWSWSIRSPKEVHMLVNLAM